MADQHVLSAEFERQRPRLRAIAHRMLGSLSDADDAIQESWLRISRADVAQVRDFPAWTTTVVSRVCLNLLRSRNSRREHPLDPFLPDPLLGPEEAVERADTVAIALLVVLETLEPDERLAFVLHDLFGVAFAEIAPMIERTPDAARQLASRARRRVRGRAPRSGPSLVRQREIVDAFFAAARDGDFDGLIAVLHPDAVFRADGLTPHPFELTGADEVARNARMFGPSSPTVRPALVNGGAGVIVVDGDRLTSITGFTIVDDRIVAIDVLADPERLARYTIPRDGADSR